MTDRTLIDGLAWIGLLQFAQVVVVPLIASSRGHSAGAWFLLVLMWELVVGGAAVVAPMISALAVSGDGTGRGAVAFAAAWVALSMLPLVVALCLRRRDHAERGASRFGARRRSHARTAGRS